MIIGSYYTNSESLSEPRFDMMYRNNLLRVNIYLSQQELAKKIFLSLIHTKSQKFCLGRPISGLDAK